MSSRDWNRHLDEEGFEKLKQYLHLSPVDFDYDVEAFREYMRGRRALVRRLRRVLSYTTRYELGLEGY